MTTHRLAACLIPLVAACNGSGSSGPGTQPDANSGGGGGDAATMADASSSGTGRPPGVALCYTPEAEANPATVMFKAALRAGNRDMRAAAIDALDAATKATPGEEELELLLGLGHLWRLGEPLAGEDSPLTQLGDAVAARDHLKTAYQLCPTDHRIPAWLGPILVRFGRNLNDTAMVEEGLMVLDQGIAAYPSFVLFSKLLVYADASREDPDFQMALDAVLANVDACTATPDDPACTNMIVPHNREGGILFLGDVLTKALKRDEAEAAYTGGMAEPGFASWSYQSELTDRLDNLDTRIELYSNASTDDDPTAAWGQANQCALCHTE